MGQRKWGKRVKGKVAAWSGEGEGGGGEGEGGGGKGGR